MATAVSVDPLLLQGDAGVAGTFKKLLHLRAAFEAPLLDVFGFPFILRHQLSAAGCCSCCSSCCCCVRAAPPRVHPQGTPRRAGAATERDAAADSAPAETSNVPSSSAAAVTEASRGATENGSAANPLSSAVVADRRSDAVVTDNPVLFCSTSRCSCCRGYADGAASVAVRGLAHPHVAASSHSSSRESSSASSSVVRSSDSRELEATRSVRRNRKRLRLVGEDTVAGVVAAAVREHRNNRNARAQDERAVEILLSRNVLRQVKLPIHPGSYVLFFTADWLHCLARCIRVAQREALLLLKEQQCCAKCGGIYLDLDHSRNRSNNTSHSADSNTGSRRESSSSSRCTYVADTNALRCSCGHSTAAAGNYNTFSSNSGVLEDAGCSSSSVGNGVCTSGSEHNVWPSKCAEDTQARVTAPLRFTAVLRQDEVQTDDQLEQCSNAGVASRSRKRVLLHLPAMLGEQLKGVLLRQLLNVCTQTDVDKRVLEEVLGGYLRAWHERRRDAVSYLREVLRSAEELLEEVNNEGAFSCEKEIHPSESASEEEAVRSAIVTNRAGTYSVNQTSSGLTKEGGRSNMHAQENANEGIRKIRARKANHDNSDGERKGSPTDMGTADGVRLRECSNDCVSVKHETGGTPTASTPPCSHTRMDKWTKADLNEDVKHRRRTEMHSSTFDSKRYTLVKRMVNVRKLLQCGCEAAAEVFSLQENVAARVARRKEDNLRERRGTEAERDEGQAGDSEEAEGRGRQRGTQEEQHGRKLSRIEHQKEEEAREWGENEGAEKGPVALGKTVQQYSEYDGGAVREQESRGVQLFSAHAAAVRLREKVHCAAAIVRLLTESEKIMSTQCTSPVLTPDTAHVKEISPDHSSGSSSAATCKTALISPAVLRATGISPTGTVAAMSSGRGLGDAANMLKQQNTVCSTARQRQDQALDERKEKEAKKRNWERNGPQHHKISDSRMQGEIDRILLLLYDVPLLHSRAGSNAVSLAVPQQGLLVRWLRDGRREILRSIRRRRFKELHWVDVERRGLLECGLGSRMALLDLKGIGEVVSTETAAGVVVRLAEEAAPQL